MKAGKPDERRLTAAQDKRRGGRRMRTGQLDVSILVQQDAETTEMLREQQQEL